MRKYAFIFSIIQLVLVTMLSGGCGGGSGSTSSQFGTGSSRVSMAVGNSSVAARAAAASVIPVEVQSIVITITANDMATISRTVPIIDHSTQALVSVDVPNGQNRYFKAEALDSGGNVLYSGQAYANLTGTAIDLPLDLQAVASSNGTVQGVTKDASTQVGIDGVTVTFSLQAGGGSPVVATTSGGGHYVVVLPAGTYSYTASKNGYTTTNGTVSVTASVTPQTFDINLQVVAVTTGTVNGTVKDASTRIGIDGVTVTLSPQAGGGSPATVTTSGGGSFTALLSAGIYSYAASKNGYSTTNGTVTVVASAVPQSLDITMALISTAYWTAVLNWGPVPEDLDLHLDVPNANGTSWTEVYFGATGNATLFPFATLDVDNQSHGTLKPDGTIDLGPETIKISRVLATGNFQTGSYKLFVKNFSGSGGNGPPFVNDASVQLTAPDGTVTVIKLSNATGSISNQNLYWYVADLNCLAGSPNTLNVTVKNILQTSPPVVSDNNSFGF